MKLTISDLIKYLEKFLEQHSDLEVGIPVWSAGKLNRVHPYVIADPRQSSGKIVTFDIYE